MKATCDKHTLRLAGVKPVQFFRLKRFLRKARNKARNCFMDVVLLVLLPVLPGRLWQSIMWTENYRRMEEWEKDG